MEVFELMLNSKLTKPEGSVEEQMDITSMVGLGGQVRGMIGALDQTILDNVAFAHRLFLFLLDRLQECID